MFRLLAVAMAAAILAGCAPKNVHQLRENPTDTLTTHSQDSVPVTAARIANGMRVCLDLDVVAEVYGENQPADVQVKLPSAWGGVITNAHLTPSIDGTDAEVTYKFAAWRSTAIQMQALANGGGSGC